MTTNSEGLSPLPLPDGITSNHVDCPAIALNFHYLEAGYDSSAPKPLLLLLHGYPELAFSWRKVMLPLASAGYHVVAPDQRGYGRTTGWDTRPHSDVDLSEFSTTLLARDVVVFVSALGYKEVACVVGHDFGAVSASTCAVVRPDIFKSLVLMSHPWKAFPDAPFGTAHQEPSEHTKSSLAGTDLAEALGNLNPPRKHYKWYHSSPSAAQDMVDAPQGLKAFLRGYFHAKSADYAANKPHPLEEWSAEQVAAMPEYYIMPRDATMPEAIQQIMQNEDAEKTTKWLPNQDLDIYVQEWSRTGFQGGLNWYRAQLDPKTNADVLLFHARKIEVPTVFVSGKQDWGNYQQPGALDKMSENCKRFHGTNLMEGAGHWPQQEQPAKVVEEILRFLKAV